MVVHGIRDYDVDGLNVGGCPQLLDVVVAEIAASGTPYCLAISFAFSRRAADQADEAGRPRLREGGENVLEREPT